VKFRLRYKIDKRAWFTDTLEGRDGVATTSANDPPPELLRKRIGRFGFTKQPSTLRCRSKNFPPSRIDCRNTNCKKLEFSRQFCRCWITSAGTVHGDHISTPPSPLFNRAARAKISNLKTSGIYHTDFSP